MAKMWCAECGNAMSRRTDGAWNSCCNRLGYWSDLKPLPNDRWYPVITHKGKTFYPTGNWPTGRVAVFPKI